MSDDVATEDVPRKRGRPKGSKNGSGRPKKASKPRPPVDDRIPEVDFERLPNERDGKVRVKRALLELTPGKIRQHSERRRKGNLSRHQIRWLEALRDGGPMPELKRLLGGFTTYVARQMLMAGFCVYIPFDKKPAWHITPAGKEALEPIQQRSEASLECLRRIAAERAGKPPEWQRRGHMAPSRKYRLAKAKA
jgi:hypothetical protein